MPTTEEINNFSLMLREYATFHEIGLWEALVQYCDKTKMESEVAASLLNKSVRMDIADEVQELNLLKRKGKKPKKLPI